MFTNYIALVSETNTITPSELNIVAAALDKQVTRDFNKPWKIESSVSAFTSLEDIPTDYWPVVVRDDIGFDAAGIHLDRDGQPFALVMSSADWSLTASHEVLEMLADPFGNRMVAGKSPKPGQGRVNFLVEVCDPSEAAGFGYTVNGVLVSDFYFENYFEPMPTGVPYSFTDSIKKPRTILKGGYLSWQVPETREWWQTTWFSGSKPTFRSLGVFDNAKFASLREFIDHNTTAPLKPRAKAAKRALTGSALYSMPKSVKAASCGRAGMLHEMISEIVGR